jgi:stage III sporulation protein SpoIIIAA
MGRPNIIQIQSVKAVNKHNNVMEINFTINRQQKTILADCTNKSIYEAIEEELKAQQIKNIVNKYDSYNTKDELFDNDFISRQLTKIANYVTSVENKKVNNFMLKITE